MKKKINKKPVAKKKKESKYKPIPQAEFTRDGVTWVGNDCSQREADGGFRYTDT